MPLDKDFARKHKFWVVLAGALGLILIAIAFLMVIVPGSIGKERDTVQGDWKKITDALKSEVRNPKHVAVAQEKAEVEKGKQKVVHRDAYEIQRHLFSFPREMEAKYDFSGGLFTLEVAVLGNDAKLDELKDEKTSDGKERYHGKITAVDGRSEWITVQGRDPKDQEKKFWRLPCTKVAEGEAKDKEFSSLQEKVGQLVTVTFERGRYFGDPLTDEEQELFKEVYKNQLWGILDELQPLNEKGETLVMFKDYVYPPWFSRLQNKEQRNSKYIQFLPPVATLAGPEGTGIGPMGGGPAAVPMAGLGGQGTGNRFFRYVAKWDDERKDISEEAWLAQEDLWVQRELFRLVKKANDYVADFVPILDPKGKAVPGVFRNPYWKIELSLLKDNQVRAKITNLLDRPQRLDVEFRVKYSQTGALVPMPRFNQEPLAPQGSGKDSFEQTFTVEDVRKVEGFYAVRQALTWETAAVRRIDQVAIGTAFGEQWAFANIDATRKPMPIKELPADKQPEPAAGDMEKGGSSLGPMGRLGGFPMGSGTQASGTPPSLTLNKLVRNRYRAVTPQARRIPVGLALIVDQAHVTRVQTAFADSPLRFRTTQVLLHRYPRTVRPDATPSAGGMYAGAGGYPGGYPGGMPGYRGSMAGYPGAAPSVPSAPYNIPGMSTLGTGLTPYRYGSKYSMPMGSGAEPGGMQGEEGSPFDPTRGSGEEVESNIELVIYGVVSIYERFPARGYALPGAEPAKQ